MHSIKETQKGNASATVNDWSRTTPGSRTINTMLTDESYDLHLWYIDTRFISRARTDGNILPIIMVRPGYTKRRYQSVASIAKIRGKSPPSLCVYRTLACSLLAVRPEASSTSLESTLPTETPPLKCDWVVADRKQHKFIDCSLNSKQHNVIGTIFYWLISRFTKYSGKM